MPSGWEAERCADALDQAKAENTKLRETIARYERGMRAILGRPQETAFSLLSGVEFSEAVEDAIMSMLDGLEAECPRCGTFVHEGPCVEDHEFADRRDEGPLD